MRKLSSQQWAQYERDGFLRMGKLLSDAELKALQQRIDDIMMGKADIDYDQMMMQLDSETGKYGDAGAQSNGFKGATLNYRKIQQLEFDPIFLTYLQRPLFRDICTRTYGPSARVACFRAMFMNKPAGRGTVLPWHQDRWHNFDRDPLVTVWAALDPSTRENGCVQIIPGSHKKLVNPDHPSGFLTPEQIEDVLKSAKPIDLILAPGEVVLLHNWTLHSSDTNRSQQSRRAFSVCYMDAATLDSQGKPVNFPIVFGEGELKPDQVRLAKV